MIYKQSSLGKSKINEINYNSSISINILNGYFVNIKYKNYILTFWHILCNRHINLECMSDIITVTK